MKDIIQEHKNGILFKISVKPNAKKQSVKAGKKKGIVVSLISPPIGGNANRELITLLKNVTGSDISIYKTHKNYQKTMFAPDISVRQFKDLMNIEY